MQAKCVPCWRLAKDSWRTSKIKENHSFFRGGYANKKLEHAAAPPSRNRTLELLIVHVELLAEFKSVRDDKFYCDQVKIVIYGYKQLTRKKNQ